MSAAPDLLSFAVPGGWLRFGADELDAWAEHLAWCYRALGVKDGDVVAVQDFGPSPLSFLASSLITPLLEAGVAERLNCRMICLDASRERVALTPSLLHLARPDVLVVRAEVAGLLVACAREQGVDLASGGSTRLIAAGGEEALATTAGWLELLLVERALLLAPRCDRCGDFHLRANRYALSDADVRSLLPPTQAPYTFQRLVATRDGGCTGGPRDLRVQLLLREDDR